MEGLPGHPVRRPGRRARCRSRAGLALTGPAGLRRRLVLLRHGRTGDNAGGRIQGQLDTPLDDVGRRQAEQAALVLATAAPAALLSSDLVRARDTAEPLSRLTGLAVRQDKRLRELDLGGWQGLTFEQARERFPAEHAAWLAGTDVPRGGGETYRDAGQRGAACLLEALPELAAGQTLIAVTHGGTAKGVVGVLLGLDPDRLWQLGALDNCSWSVLVEHSLGWRLDRHAVPAAALG